MISVVIPTHNRADLLPRAIKSVQAQTLRDLEIIIVSDGSEDNTREVVENLAEDDNRIKFIEYYPAKGGNIARNTGIENAAGEYVAFLDDDDEFLPEKLEKQLAEFNSNSKCGLVYTGVNIIYVNEKIEYTFIGKKRGDLKIDILLDNYIGTTSTVMVRTKLLKDVGMFDTNLRALQDFELWIRVCQYCEVSVVPEILINYYNYTGSTQVSAFTQKYIDSFTYIYDKHEKLFLKLTEAQTREKGINENMLLANKAMRNNNKKLARAYARKALKIGFSRGAVLYWLLSFTSFRTVLKIRSIK